MANGDGRATTKVERIVGSIIDEIGSGNLRGGDRIDSERALAQRFSVSLVTAQRALKTLQDRGVLVREHGRGTFVRGTESTVVDAQLIRFKDETGQVLPIETNVLRTQPLDRAGTSKTIFDAAAGDIVEITRRIAVGGRFKLLSHFLLRREEFDRLQSQGVSANIREQLAGALGLPTLRVEQDFAFVQLGALACFELAVPHPSTGFRLDLKAYTLQDQPLFQQHIYGRDFAGTSWSIVSKF